MPLVEPIKVYGLADFQRAVKQLQGDLPGYMRTSLKEVAHIIYDDAIRKIPVRTGRTKRSARIYVQRSSVGIKAGGDIAPWFPFLDFGGSTGRGHRPRVAWSGAIKRKWLGRPVGEGRYFWKSFSEHHQEVQDRLNVLFLSVARRAGLDADYVRRREFLAADAEAHRREMS